jgi:quercetin dioxygenase-like cupin family protein
MNEPTGGLPAGEPVRLGALLDYVPGSVVSRELLKNTGGTITLFSFDEGQGLSEHTAPFDALVQILDGEAKLTIGGKEIEVQAGNSVLMPADIPHAVHALDRFKMLLIMLRGESGK